MSETIDKTLLEELFIDNFKKNCILNDNVITQFMKENNK